MARAGEDGRANSANELLACGGPLRGEHWAMLHWAMLHRATVCIVRLSYAGRHSRFYDC